MLGKKKKEKEKKKKIRDTLFFNCDNESSGEVGERFRVDFFGGLWVFFPQGVESSSISY